MAYSLMMTSAFLVLMQLAQVFTINSARAQTAPNAPSVTFQGQGGTQSGMVQPQPGAMPQAGVQTVPPGQLPSSAIGSEAAQGSTVSRGVMSNTNTRSPSTLGTTSAAPGLTTGGLNTGSNLNTGSGTNTNSGINTNSGTNTATGPNRLGEPSWPTFVPPVPNVRQ